MTFDDLEDLGFEVVGERDDPRLAAELMTPIANPLTRRFISRAIFRLDDERLVVMDPPELVGLPPIPTEGLTRMSDVASRLQESFDDYTLRLQRRSSELLSLGLEPHVDPATLELTAYVDAHDLRMHIAADRSGRFHVVGATSGGVSFDVPEATAFELSEFRDGHALVAFLEALVTGDVHTAVAARSQPAAATQWEPAPPAPHAAPPRDRAIRVGDLWGRFGMKATIPARTPVELVVELSVGGVPHRFAASRLVGRTFRGLLAGPSGKVWADRFELDDFPGIEALVARELDVEEEDVEILGPAS